MFKGLTLLLMGFLLALGAAELALRALPVSTGYDLRSVDAANPVLHGTPRSDYTYSRAWNFQLENSGKLNNHGFRASYDFLPDPRAVAVIGNSFIQADAVDPRDTMAERLAAALRVPVYGIGVDGFSLADYLSASRWAADTFQAHTLLVLLTTGDLRHSCTARLGEHYLKRNDGALSLALVERPEPSRAKRLLNDSRLFRYVFDNLRVSANWYKGWRREAEAEPTSEAAVPGCAGGDFEEAATRFLLKGFQELQTEASARVIFLVAPGYRREQGVKAGAARDIDFFADRAMRLGFELVRLDAAFTGALRSGERLDFMPIDGHWNATANLLAARTVTDTVSRGSH